MFYYNTHAPFDPGPNWFKLTLVSTVVSQLVVGRWPFGSRPAFPTLYSLISEELRLNIIGS